MANNNRREIELALSITTANADALTKLQQDVRGLAKEGGDAAPAFQKLADELGQLAEQAKQLTALEGLTQELKAAATAQVDAASKSTALKQTLDQLVAATDAAREAEAIAADTAQAGLVVVGRAEPGSGSGDDTGGIGGLHSTAPSWPPSLVA